MTIGTGIQLTVPNVDKAQAGVLFLEFWTSKGFEEYKASYNSLILRINGYGNLIQGIFNHISDLKDVPWEAAPMELTCNIQSRPTKTIYDITFLVGAGISEHKSGEFQRAVSGWVDEFMEFIEEWINA